MKSILWLIMIFVLVSNLFSLVAIGLREKFRRECHNTNQQQNVFWLWDFLTCLFEGISLTFTNFAFWLLVYKYWEVSWTVPLQLEKIQPSQRMKWWLKCGYISSFAVIGILMVTLTSLWLWQSLAYNPENECFVNKVNQGMIYSYTYSILVFIYLVIMVFFVSSIARIYRSMRLRKDLTLNLKSMAIYCAFFVAYVLTFTVWIICCIRSAS